MAGAPLEIAGPHKRTEKGNNDHYYGGGDVAWGSMAEALAGVPIAIRPGKTIGVISAGQIIEYMWPATGDVTGTPVKKSKPLEDMLDNKVDKDGSKVLSDHNFTDALFTKLNNIIEHYKGKYATLAALQGSLPLGLDGDYVIIDGGTGSDAVEYIWDSTDSTWKPSSNTGASSFAQLAGSPNDNPSLQSALQASLDRTNHNGKQLANTVSDFNDAVLLSLITGINFNDASAITALDNVRDAMGKLQAQIGGNITGLANEIANRQNAVANKRDKLVTYYATQTVAFTPLSAMADTVIRCNFSADTMVTLPVDGTFITGQEFCLRQTGDGGIKLTPAAGVTINAPQGYNLNAKFSEVWIRKEAANIYSLRFMGTDPSIQKGFTLSFVSPVREYKDYFEKPASIIKITLDGISTFQYSTNGGISYKTISLPLEESILIPADTFVRWRVTFTSSTTMGAAFIKLA
ncbi:hypothetical protein ABDD95_15625 [Mucilaginibacter sp. PAMB04274]|uniref:hypothetical protein n=1 Tax=Mucilaginibacter sp. PAMB04274 TaxID=3138568 RepID=UPI0031F72249